MAHRRRLVAAALAAVGAWGVLTVGAWASPASAATPIEVLTLRLQPCPAYDVTRMVSHSPAEVQAAKSGSFEVQGRPATLIPPVNWTQDPYHDRSWVHYLHGFSWVDQLLYGYVHGGDVAALTQARDLLLDWIAGNPLPPAVSDRTENWKDKTAGDRAGYLGFVTRAAACEGLLSDAQASALLDSVRRHAAVLADPAVYEVHNHGLFADIGLARLAVYGGFLPEAPGWLSLARQRFHSTLTGRLFESEGLWLEHSTTYQFAAIRLAEAFGERYGAVLGAGDLARMRDVAGWLVTPEGRKVPYGDSDSHAAPEWGRQEAADDHGLLLLRRSGIAAVKDDGGYLLVTAGFHNRTHKHADDLGFHLYDRGRDLVTDTGVLHYNFDKWRAFSASAAAHSVLTVGRRNLPINEDRRAYGSGIRAGGEGDGWYAIEAATPLLRPQGVRHRRLFLYHPGHALVVIDLLRAQGERRYRRRLQLAPGIGHRRDGAKVSLSSEGFAGGVRAGGGRTRLRIAKGQYTPPRGWSFPGSRRRVPRPTLEYATRAKNARLVTAVGLHGGLRANLVRAGGRSVTVAVEGAAVRRSRLEVKRVGDELVVDRRRGRGH